MDDRVQVELPERRTIYAGRRSLAGKLNSEQYPDYHRLDFRAEYTRPRDWGHWKFHADVLNVYDQENVASYEYAPNGRKLISPPSGYGQGVPVTQTTRDEFFPSIGFEVQF
jgi:hypothetical protein